MQDISEHTKALQWRKRMGLSRRVLAELTGYSERSIQAFESGKKPNGEPICPDAMKRYRLTCATVQVGMSFDWQEATLEVTERRRVAI